MAQRWTMHTPLCPGGGGARCCPCHSAAHCRHMKRQPSLVSFVMTVIVPIAIAITVAIAIAVTVSITVAIAIICRPLPSPLPLAITVAVTVCHCQRCFRCCCCCHRRCHSNCRQALPSPLPSAIAVSHRRRHCCWPLLLQLLSLSPLPLPFKQFKQIMLTLFYLVWTVSGALITWMTDQESGGNKRWPTPALGGKQQATSS
jgi:hypothetical protein